MSASLSDDLPHPKAGPYVWVRVRRAAGLGWELTTCRGLERPRFHSKQS